MKDKAFTKKLAFSGLFLAIGMVLPLLTAQIKEIGDSLLPMHLAVMLCGFICGGKYGLIVGLCLPFLRSAIFGMPPMYPNAVWMALELATYGFVTGFLGKRFFNGKLWWVYCALIIAMLSGRVVWGIAKAVLLGFKNQPFTFSAFIVGGFVDAVPGIILQLVLIPPLVRLIGKHLKW